MTNAYIESSGFKRLNFPDPFKYGPEYTPIFPPRHHTMKAIMDNLTDTVSKVYVFGSAIRLDCATDSDLDVFIVGELTNPELARIIRAVPEGESADLMVESEEEFMKNLDEGSNSLYRSIYEKGYKIYDRKAK